MSTASELFQTLSGFQKSETGFLEYCRQILGAVERSHFDFKEKADRRDAILGDTDKKNLAKAVSGFANSGGGVLIWGIKDETLDHKPITDIQKFVSNLLGLASKTTDPFVSNIDGTWISDDGKTGYALINIPESHLPPHRVALKGDIQHHYYVRTASSFEVATHTMLEDMFGRRPKAQLQLTQEWRLEPGFYPQRLVLTLGIKNTGRGTAKLPYFALHVASPHQIDGGSRNGLGAPRGLVGSPFFHYFSAQSVYLHPGMSLDVVDVRLQVYDQHFLHPSNGSLRVSYRYTAEGLQMSEGEIVVNVPEQVGIIAKG